jgi:hypothetical protein
MKNLIGLSVFGTLLVVTATALAGPPARGVAESMEGARCPLACVTNVAPHLTRAALFGTVVPRCYKETSTAVRWGKAPTGCPQNTQVASCK